MKLTLVFLTICVCLVATSLGQSLLYWPFSWGNGQQSYWPVSNPRNDEFAARSPASRRQYFGDYNPYYNYYNDEPEASPYEVEGRRKISYFRKQPFFPAPGSPALQEQRLLFRNNAASTSFVTVYGTTATATSAVVTSCISRSQFKTATPTACRRKREYVPYLQEDLAIEPSAVNKVEATQVEDTDNRHQRSIESSQDVDDYDYPYHPAEAAHVRASPRPRLFNALNLIFPSTTTTTITIPTSYVFVTTFITRQILLGSASQLLCLPSGYDIC